MRVKILRYAARQRKPFVTPDLYDAFPTYGRQVIKQQVCKLRAAGELVKVGQLDNRGWGYRYEIGDCNIPL